MTEKLKKPRAPKCACCGRTLSKLKDHCNDGFSRSNIHRAQRLQGNKIDGNTTINVIPFTADGSAPTRGMYGDNLVCSQVCGHVLAVRLIAALGVDVLKLLPEPWRPR